MLNTATGAADTMEFGSEETVRSTLSVPRFAPCLTALAPRVVCTLSHSFSPSRSPSHRVPSPRLLPAAQVAEMVTKFTAINANAAAYEWSVRLPGGQALVLDRARTLEEQGFPDDGPELAALGLDAEDEDNMQTVVLRFVDKAPVSA